MTGNIVHIRSYTRRKVRDEKPDPILMELLATDLLMKLAEPLDWIEIPEEQARRIRESF